MGLKSKHFTYVLEQELASDFRKVWWHKDVRGDLQTKSNGQQIVTVHFCFILCIYASFNKNTQWIKHYALFDLFVAGAWTIPLSSVQMVLLQTTKDRFKILGVCCFSKGGRICMHPQREHYLSSSIQGKIVKLNLQLQLISKCKESITQEDFIDSPKS